MYLPPAPAALAMALAPCRKYLYLRQRGLGEPSRKDSPRSLFPVASGTVPEVPAPPALVPESPGRVRQEGLRKDLSLQTTYLLTPPPLHSDEPHC